MLSFGAMATAARGLHEQLPCGPEDRMLSYLPLAHVFERWIIGTGAFLARFQLFFAESLDTFVQDLNRARPTMFVSVPRLWQKFQLGVFAKMPAKKLATLLKIPILGGVVRKKVLRGLGLDACRFAGSGSAPIPPELIQWYRDLGLELLEGYGMTENFCYSHVSRPGRARVGYVGEPYPGVETRISEEGEIQIKSPGMMIGYYKAPELTAEAFTADGWLRTGDRGEVDSMNRLRITGRVKELFKTSKGKYVAPAPIENKIQVHEAIEAVCVGGLGREAPYALAALSDEARKRVADPEARRAVEASLRAHLEQVNASLDPHEAVAMVVLVKDSWLVDNGFLTPTMKIRRPVIEERYAPRIDEWYGQGKPVVWEA
jgi:long-subunit acyl-CoA synthetase (AMP-forming)